MKKLYNTTISLLFLLGWFICLPTAQALHFVEGEINSQYATFDHSFTLQNDTLPADLENIVDHPVLFESGAFFNKPAVQLFPNPVDGPFVLEINSDEWFGSTATIYNLIGEALDTRYVSLGDNAYDISSYTRGIYFMKLSNDRQQQTIRFVKR